MRSTFTQLMSIKEIDKLLNDLYPFCRSITGEGTRKTLDYIKENELPQAEIKTIPSGSKVFDWVIPPEWIIRDAYIKNKFGEKIVDFKENNLHLLSYSAPVSISLNKEELLKKIHTLPDHPNWIPYRTSYYKKDWGFCCKHNLLSSKKFVGPFEVVIDSEFNKNGNLNWLECVKTGKSRKEILISTYCCHPSLANDNLSGMVAAVELFKYLLNIETKYTYRLLIAPETIGVISFLSQSDISDILGGMIISCVAGPDEFSIKEGFDNNHWINKAAIFAIREKTKNKFKIYPFVPDGSDERQYSSPGIRIVTPSIHKSKYYEYPEYHTSADDLKFISATALSSSLEIYKKWISNIESYCYPVRKITKCEFQLGKRGMYPDIGGTLSQAAHIDNKKGDKSRRFVFNKDLEITGMHINSYGWLMHLSDGTNSNFDIAEKSDIPLNIINESISIFYQKNLLELR